MQAPIEFPMQRVSWSEKIKHDFAFFKRTADYYISSTGFYPYNSEEMESMDELYRIYNGEYPDDWFSHILNPTQATDEQFTHWPAKIRQIAMLRTNIDVIIGEYPDRRPVYQVENLAEEAYNAFLDTQKEAVLNNLQQQLANTLNAEGVDSGIPTQQIPSPEEIATAHQLSYKDQQAVRGQKWLSRAVPEYEIDRKQHEGFKDYAIAGQVVSYKGIRGGRFVYERMNPMFYRGYNSAMSPFFEDDQAGVALLMLSLSELVDLAYEELKNSDYEYLEKSHLTSPQTF